MSYFYVQRDIFFCDVVYMLFADKVTKPCCFWYFNLLKINYFLMLWGTGTFPSLLEKSREQLECGYDSWSNFSLKTT